MAKLGYSTIGDWYHDRTGNGYMAAQTGNSLSLEQTTVRIELPTANLGFRSRRVIEKSVSK